MKKTYAYIPLPLTQVNTLSLTCLLYVRVEVMWRSRAGPSPTPTSPSHTSPSTSGSRPRPKDSSTPSSRLPSKCHRIVFVLGYFNWFCLPLRIFLYSTITIFGAPSLSHVKIFSFCCCIPKFLRRLWIQIPWFWIRIQNFGPICIWVQGFRQCCGSGMIYSGSGSSFEFSEFRIHADPDPQHWVQG